MVFVHITQWTFLEPKMPGRKEGYFWYSLWAKNAQFMGWKYTGNEPWLLNVRTDICIKLKIFIKISDFWLKKVSHRRFYGIAGIQCLCGFPQFTGKGCDRWDKTKKILSRPQSPCFTGLRGDCDKWDIFF